MLPRVDGANSESCGDSGDISHPLVSRGHPMVQPPENRAHVAHWVGAEADGCQQFCLQMRKLRVRKVHIHHMSEPRLKPRSDSEWVVLSTSVKLSLCIANRVRLKINVFLMLVQ